MASICFTVPPSFRHTLSEQSGPADYFGTCPPVPPSPRPASSAATPTIGASPPPARPTPPGRWADFVRGELQSSDPPDTMLIPMSLRAARFRPLVLRPRLLSLGRRQRNSVMRSAHWLYDSVGHCADPTLRLAATQVDAFRAASTRNGGARIILLKGPHAWSLQDRHTITSGFASYNFWMFVGLSFIARGIGLPAGFSASATTVPRRARSSRSGSHFGSLLLSYSSSSASWLRYTCSDGGTPHFRHCQSAIHWPPPMQPVCFGSGSISVEAGFRRGMPRVLLVGAVATAGRRTGQPSGLPARPRP